MKKTRRARIIFYSIFLPVVFVAFLLLCDYLYYTRMLVKYQKLVANDALRSQCKGPILTLQDIKSIYGEPETLTSDRIGYTAYDFTNCPTFFPFFEILLTGSTSHFKRRDIEFVMDKDGNTHGYSISDHDGLFKHKLTFEEEQRMTVEWLKRWNPSSPVKTITTVVTKPTQIAVVSDLTPDPYAHPSTHPASLKFESGSSEGHGDGVAEVHFVGKTVEVVSSGELRPVPNVKFFQLNDNMLLKESRHDLLSFQSDDNGNFDAVLLVFAARSYIPSTNEHVIYQTGTAKIAAEADGFKPRQVNVRYEQPATLIIMSRE